MENNNMIHKLESVVDESLGLANELWRIQEEFEQNGDQEHDDTFFELALKADCIHNVTKLTMEILQNNG